MANFTDSAAKRTAVRNANNLLTLIQSFYGIGKQIQQALAFYQSGTDPTFNAAVNALFIAAERTELAAMGTAVTTLITDWETNHAGALS